MKRSVKWILAFFVISSSVAIATVAVDFTADSTFTGKNRLRVKGDLFLGFTIDDSGRVLLDASVSRKNSADVINTVNGWDGVVGVVAAPSLFNTSFSFTAKGWRRNDAGNDFIATDISIEGDGPGYLGIAGQDAGAIDGALTPTKNVEMLVMTLSTLTAGLEVDVISFSWDGRGDMFRSVMVFDHDSKDSWYLQSDAKIMSINGYVIRNGEPITFSIPESGKTGYGLCGFDFEVAPSSMAKLAPLPASGKVASGNPTMMGLRTY